MTARLPDDGESGLTLVELLVALVLMALIAVMMSGGIRFGVRAWEAADARVEDDTRIQAVQALLRRQFNRAYPAIGADARKRSQVDFEGRANSLRFITALPAHLSPGGRSVVALEGAADDVPALILRWRPHRPGFGDDDDEAAGADGEWAEEHVLIEGIEGMEFAYFGAEKPGDDPRWFDDWQERRTLPTLVRLRLSFAEDDRRTWPELVADLPITARAR